MKLEYLVKNYHIIYEAHKNNSIFELVNELEMCQKYIYKKIMYGKDPKTFLEESLVLSDLIRKQSENIRKYFLKILDHNIEKAKEDYNFEYLPDKRLEKLSKWENLKDLRLFFEREYINYPEFKSKPGFKLF